MSETLEQMAERLAERALEIESPDRLLDVYSLSQLYTEHQALARALKVYLERVNEAVLREAEPKP